jgi:hypothetical protein
MTVLLIRSEEMCSAADEEERKVWPLEHVVKSLYCLPVAAVDAHSAVRLAVLTWMIMDDLYKKLQSSHMHREARIQTHFHNI